MFHSLVMLLCLAGSPNPSRDRVVDAVAAVESGNNPDAPPGDGGRAVGVLQIHPIMVRDVNRILGRERYSLADRKDPAKSREMFWVYADHYSPGASAEVIARRWNGGPDGDADPRTLGYWRRVRRALDPGAR